LYGDENKTPVVRKSLLAPKGDFEKDWLRTNIFLTARFAKIIIDSDSCENVVSEEVVKKLHLKTDLLGIMYLQVSAVEKRSQEKFCFKINKARLNKYTSS
jgi:hypothetical protein